jgi:proteasome assembly chaperone (PAC2) family protein
VFKKKLSADSVCSLFSMTLKKLLLLKKKAEIIENVQNEFYYRLGYCQVVQGQHSEHLL